MKRYEWQLNKLLGCVSFFRPPCLEWILWHLMNIMWFWYFSASFAHIAHPIGSLVSGPICDLFGRRKTFMIVSVPLLAGWIILSNAQSFPIICFGFLLLGFCLGVKDAPAVTYCCEIRCIFFCEIIRKTIYSINLNQNVL